MRPKAMLCKACTHLLDWKQHTLAAEEVEEEGFMTSVKVLILLGDLMQDTDI